MFAVAAAGCAVLVCAALLALSIDAVEQNQYGLKYNWVTKSISTDVFHGGTHFIGPWNAFVTFPATVQTIEFSDRFGQRTAEKLHTRTKEGLGLHLSISFQYRLLPDELHKLYRLTNTQYEMLFTRIARDQMLEAASQYEGPQYWLQRHEIGNRMKGLVSQQLRDSYADLWGLQLLVIDLPDRYEQSITMTQVQQQLIKTRTNQQAAASIRADTEVMKADFDSKVQVVQAEAQANYTLETRMAEAEAAKRKIAAEAEALGYLRHKLKLSVDGAVQYQELSAFGNLPNATFLANVPLARVTVGIGGSAPSLLQQGTSGQSAATHMEAAAAAGSPEAADAGEPAGGEAVPQRAGGRAPPAGHSLRARRPSRFGLEPPEEGEGQAAAFFKRAVAAHLATAQGTA
mmetsp:Transcript_69746/g.181714  ORF Transcript_69746/g.181714 Transcript_69746/m.181714 type:complete len:401 (-) Transcript_69746:152-1354(-)